LLATQKHDCLRKQNDLDNHQQTELVSKYSDAGKLNDKLNE